MVEDKRNIMRLLLEEARSGEGQTGTNPLVGAGLVKHGELLASAAHTRFGGPHAEARLLDEVDEVPPGAELYTTLEPCIHHGKTGPCVEKILSAGIEKVVVAHEDPDPANRGQGMDALLREGLEVEFPLLRQNYRWLNRTYFYHQRTGYPWLEAKLALSADGYIATSEHHSQWLSGEASREHTHRLRSRVDAVLVGAETVRRDDPRLTDRVTGSEIQPSAVVVTRSPETIPLSTPLFSERAESTILVAPPGIKTDLKQTLLNRGVTLLTSDLYGDSFCWPQVLRRLVNNGVGRILVEGGGRVIGDLISSQLLNEVHLFYCGHFLGGGIQAASLAEPAQKVFNSPCGKLIAHRQFGEDVYVRRLFQETLRRAGLKMDPPEKMDRVRSGGSGK